MYTFDRRKPLFVAFVALTVCELLLLYGFFFTGFYRTIDLRSGIIIGTFILAFLALDCLIAYFSLHTSGLEFHQDVLRVGRSSKAKDIPYSDLWISQVTLESRSFTTSSKSGDSSAKWRLLNVRIKKLDTSLIAWLEERMERTGKVSLRGFRFEGFILMTQLFLVPFLLVYFLLLFRRLSTDLPLDILIAAIFVCGAVGCSYSLFNYLWNRTMKTGEKFKSMMEAEGYKPKNMREFKEKMKEYKERIKAQDEGKSS